MKKLLIVLLFTLSSSLLTYCLAQYNIIYSFNNTGGANPVFTTLIRNGNKLYGMTEFGGAHNMGVVFSVDTNGNNYADLLDFNGLNGSTPGGSLIISGNRLFGMTYAGGAHDSGCIFSIGTNGNGYRDLVDLDAAKGKNPLGSLSIIGNKLFGMTRYGGVNNYGVIFSVDTNGSGYKKLLNFNITNGSWPQGSLTISGNKMFGMTAAGGANGAGLIFSIDTSGSNYKDLFDFNFSNGLGPDGSLVLSGKRMFGMTYQGGANNDGVIFAIDTDGNRYADLLDFNNFVNGEFPQADLTLSGKTLYGMAPYGGPLNYGIVFSIDTNGAGYRDMHDFNSINGFFPYGSLLLSGKYLYGMTYSGGASNYGLIFSLKDTNIVLGANTLAENPGSARLFPNPCNGKFTIEVNSEELRTKSTVEIYNMLGEKVYTTSLNPSKGGTSNTTISLPLGESQSGAGIYLYRIITETGELVAEGKFVIQ